MTLVTRLRKAMADHADEMSSDEFWTLSDAAFALEAALSQPQPEVGSVEHHLQRLECLGQVHGQPDILERVGMLRAALHQPHTEFTNSAACLKEGITPPDGCVEQPTPAGNGGCASGREASLDESVAECAADSSVTAALPHAPEPDLTHSLREQMRETADEVNVSHPAIAKLLREAARWMLRAARAGAETVRASRGEARELTEAPLSAATLESLIKEAEREFMKRDDRRNRAGFIARYIYDSLHPEARVVDVNVPEAKG